MNAIAAVTARACTDAGAPVVEARALTKRFGPHIALADVDLCVRAGESHALVGRNGAGKSTLVSILTGLRKPDAGVVRFAGEAAPPLADRDGWRARVACVYQHSTIIRELTVAENLFINRQPTKRGAIDWRALRRDARALLEHWRIDVSENARAGDLTVEARQLVEIARALSYGARFIVLDEPTAQLDGDEIKRLFARIRELQRDGVTFLFISHHLQEVYDICQAVTVLRDARRIVSAPVAALPPGASAPITLIRNRMPMTVMLGSGAAARAPTGATAWSGNAAAGRSETGGADRLGLTMHPLTDDERRSTGLPVGMVVDAVRGPAANAGIRPGDVVLELDDTLIETPDMVPALEAKAGKVVAVLIQRGSERRFVSVKAR